MAWRTLLSMTRVWDDKVSLQQLEHEVRVPLEEQVEVVAPATATPPDPRGAQPDRDWFAAGG